MKNKASWVTIACAIFLWFSLGMFCQNQAIGWLTEPDITGTWRFMLDKDTVAELIVDETHIDFMGNKSEYNVKCDQNFIILTIPISELQKQRTAIDADNLMVIFKVHDESLRLISLGLETELDFVKVANLEPKVSTD